MVDAVEPVSVALLPYAIASWGGWLGAAVLLYYFVRYMVRFVHVYIDDGWFFARRHLLHALGCLYGFGLGVSLGLGWR